MSKVQSTLMLDAQMRAIYPATTEDIQALAAAVAAIAPIASLKARVITLDLTAAKAAQPVDLQGLTEVHAVTVKSLEGTLSLHMGGALEPAIPAAAGETRTGFRVAALAFSTPGSAGGTATLELHGR